MDAQESNLIGQWKKLTDDHKEDLSCYLRFLLEKQELIHEDHIAKETEQFKSKMTEVRSFSVQITDVAMKTRQLLYDNLPKEIRELILNLEMLIAFRTLSDYRPSSLFPGEENQYRKTAEKFVGSTTRKLKKLNSQPA